MMIMRPPRCFGLGSVKRRREDADQAELSELVTKCRSSASRGQTSAHRPVNAAVVALVRQRYPYFDEGSRLDDRCPLLTTQ
jgi:hypothetical protein